MVATKPVDFRKAHDGLVALVKNELRKDPFTGTVFVFHSRKADRLKLIYWDGTGAVLAYKRLEAIHLMSSSRARFEALFAGLDWCRVQAMEAREPDLHLRWLPTKATVAHMLVAKMLIPRPVADVFDVFVDPSVTSRFWFSKANGKLEPGTLNTWMWNWYDFSVDVDVKEVTPNRRILVEWTNYGYPTTIEWLFTARPDSPTFLTITNKRFQDSVKELAQTAIAATGGYVRTCRYQGLAGA